MPKKALVAICAAALFAAACGSVLPWNKQPDADEVNLAFVVNKNLLYLPSVTIDSRPGRIFFSTAAPKTVIDPKFMPAGGSHVVKLNQRGSLALDPVAMDLHGTGDAMLGADAWNSRAITVDYHAGLLTFQQAGIFTDMMTLYSFKAAPMINLTVDGQQISAVVDTASPDTLEIPSDKAGRTNAQISIAGSDFGPVDIALSPGLSAPRIGNRLLSKFLVSIDYKRGIVGLWRDPRNG